MPGGCILATNPRRFVGWPWLNAACLAVGRKFWHRRQERESDAVRAAALICLLLLPGVALDAGRPATAEIRVAHGTGFFVSKDGRLLTNFHVIDSCRQLAVQSGRLSGAARVVATDAANDLALLATNLKPARIADWRYSLREDEPVVVYGFPLAGERAVDGKVLGLTGWRNNKLVFTETGLEPGMSGSAVLDGSGLVIGISVEEVGRVLGRAAGSTAMAALLDAHGVTHPAAREATPLSKSAIIERAKAISVKVTCQRDDRSTDAHACQRAGGTFVPDDKNIESCNRQIPSGRFSGEALKTMYLQRAESQLRKSRPARLRRGQEDCRGRRQFSLPREHTHSLGGLWSRHLRVGCRDPPLTERHHGAFHAGRRLPR